MDIKGWISGWKEGQSGERRREGGKRSIYIGGMSKHKRITGDRGRVGRRRRGGGSREGREKVKGHW